MRSGKELIEVLCKKAGLDSVTTDEFKQVFSQLDVTRGWTEAASSNPRLNAMTSGDASFLGDLTAGGIASGQTNVFWDAKNQQLQLRVGTEVISFISGSRAFGNMGVHVHRSTAQTITLNTATAIIYDVEDFDDAGFWDSGNPTRLTVPANQGGNYLIGGTGIWSTSSGSARVALNGDFSDILCLDFGELTPFVITEEVLAAGDYIEFVVENTATRDFGISGSASDKDRAEFWMRRTR